MLTARNINSISLLALIGILLFDFFSESIEISMWIYIVLGIFWLFFTIAGSFNITWNYHLNAINKVAISEKKIVLSFDDGPHAIYTPQILELLKKYNATATFFCIGKHVEQHPEIVKKIVSEGHLIGNHTYSHSNYFDFYSSKKVIAELKKTDDLVKTITGKKLNFFRPPFGVTNPAIAKAIHHTKHQVIGWNVRSLDTVIKNKNKCVNRVIRKITPGAIVLLHDSHENSIYILEQLLIFLQDNNYQTVSLETLIHTKAYA